MTHQYQIECFTLGKWLKLFSGGVQFLQGYLDARSDLSPRLAYRIMRSDGKIVEEIKAREDVSVGIVAGFPTAEQYEAAAKRAFDMAAAIRARKKDTHHNPTVTHEDTT